METRMAALAWKVLLFASGLLCSSKEMEIPEPGTHLVQLEHAWHLGSPCLLPALAVGAFHEQLGSSGKEFF